MAKTERPLSDKAKEILEVLKESETPMTAQDFKEKGIAVNGSHFRALENRGLVSVSETEITVSKVRKVNAYEFVNQTDSDNE